MFLGKDQLTFGVVPLDDGCHSAQSAKSVMPISMANCREKRSVLLLTIESPPQSQAKLLTCFAISIDIYHHTNGNLLIFCKITLEITLA